MCGSRAWITVFLYIRMYPTECVVTCIPLIIPLLHPSICSPRGESRKKSLSSKVFVNALSSKTLGFFSPFAVPPSVFPLKMGILRRFFKEPEAEGSSESRFP